MLLEHLVVSPSDSLPVLVAASLRLLPLVYYCWNQMRPLLISQWYRLQVSVSLVPLYK